MKRLLTAPSATHWCVLRRTVPVPEVGSFGLRTGAQFGALAIASSASQPASALTGWATFRRLQRTFGNTPAAFGYSCSDPERILLPGTEDDVLTRRTQFLALPGVFGLSDERWQLTFGAPGTFAQLNSSSGVISEHLRSHPHAGPRHWFVGSTRGQF